MLTYEIISSVKRAFSRSKQAHKLKTSAVLKDVTGKRGGKMVKCNDCGKIIPMYSSQVDHISPICPVEISLKVMSFNMLYERTFCDNNNLQVICKECHDKKNKIERKQRASWRKKKKYLVCRVAQGSRLKVIPIVDLKTLPEIWEVLSVHRKRKDADADLKRRKKL
jgi:5-methylcytosine-specific restriction endonuclease McrA